MSKKTEILQHSRNEKIVRQMLSTGCTNREIADYYECTLLDVRKFIDEVIR